MVTSVSGEGDRQNAAIALAKTVADAAQAVADAVNQHFFADTNGIHVTEVTQEDWDESHTGANAPSTPSASCSGTASTTS